jgi:hypothetical protein
MVEFELPKGRELGKRPFGEALIELNLAFGELSKQPPLAAYSAGMADS